MFLYCLFQVEKDDVAEAIRLLEMSKASLATSQPTVR